MLTRRKFIKLCLQGAAYLSLSQLLLPELAEALSLLPGGKPPVIWLEGTSCTGESISLVDSVDPSLREILEKVIDLRFSQLYMWAENREALKILETVKKEHRDRFILVVEGGIPMALPTSVVVGEDREQPLLARNLVPELANAASLVIAVGNCAAFGGPSKASPNPTGTRGVWNLVSQKPVINVPGCPAHPDWMVGTLVHCILYGIPPLDDLRRPTMFYGELVHDRCPRRFHFYNGIFAKAPGEEGCLFKVGCKGPVTHADCPVRKFNDGVNWCINANNPCIGCAAPDFPDGSTSPFFSHLSDIRVPPAIRTTALTVTKVVAGATAVGLGAHFYKTRTGEKLHDKAAPRGREAGEDEESSRPSTLPKPETVKAKKPRPLFWGRLLAMVKRKTKLK